MAATYSVILRAEPELEIENVERFEADEGLVSALDDDGKVVAVFPIQGLTGIVRTDTPEQSDVIRVNESKLGMKITNHFPPPTKRNLFAA